MRISRRALRRQLTEQTQIDPPAPRDSFVAQLEQRIRTVDLTADDSPASVRHIRRGLSRGAAIGVVAALASGAGAAAIAFVAGRNDDPPAIVTESTGVSPTSLLGPSTTTAGTIESITTTPTTPVSSVAPPTAVVPTVPAASDELASTAPPATEPPVAATEPPPTVDTAPVTVTPTAVAPTVPETSASVATPTSSTEVHVPATIGLDCGVDAVAATCTWSPGPEGTDHYVVLRSTPSESNGRVFYPEPGATTYIDNRVLPGNTYTYLIHALDAANKSLAHSAPATVTCCG